MVGPFTGYGLIQRAGVYIRAPSQRGHTVDPLAQPLPPLMFEQSALDFGQGQDRWHGQILPATAPRQKLIISGAWLSFWC
jgi:hypothetical protein